mgnify:FL=1
MKGNIKNIVLLVACVCIVGVGIGSIFIFGFNNGNLLPDVPSNNPGTSHVLIDDGSGMQTEYQESNRTNKAAFTYLDVNESAHSPITPSTGDVKILVVPVNFDLNDIRPYERRSYIDFNDDNYLEAMEYTFNGVSSLDGTNPYWESVSSYYEKSSYKKLNLNFEIADPFTPEMSASEFLSKEDLTSSSSSVGGSQALITDILEHGLTKNDVPIDIFDSKYDRNEDGYIDGMWLIYNVIDGDLVSSESQPFWAYTTNYLAKATDTETGEIKIVGTRYANCALSFLYDDSTLGYDAHTIIHETGHMLGLDDYYSYDNSGNYGYLGGIDMMDLNIGDHSAFSKYALGWIEPTVIYKNDTTITLKPFEDTGEALIIPSSYYNDSAFSEYLILEYETPTGLNELDATKKYRNAYPLAFSNGLAIHHVDARLIKHEIQNGYYTCGDYLSENESSVPEVEVHGSREDVYLVGNSNTPSYNGISDDYALVRLISKERTLYSENPKTSRVGSTRRDLYQTGDSFGADQVDMFFSHNTFNNGTPINNISIKVTSMNDEGITLHISR